MSGPPGTEAPAEQARSEEFELSGGALCLDLANTVSDRPTEPRDRLTDYAALLRWSLQAELLSERQADLLRAEGAAHPRRSRRVLERAADLRESVYRIFSALAREEPATEEDLAVLNEELGRSLRHQTVETHDGHFAWGWSGAEADLERILWPVARSAADLLVSDEAGSVRECAADTCGWLFVDRSRSRRRKWCDMAVCGNRAKARRHYRRHRTGDSGTS